MDSILKKVSFYFFLLLLVFPVISFSPKINADFGVKTVVIDAGHGGKDPGCHGAKFNEKDVALGIALRLGKYIEQNFPDVKVVFTRKTDVFVELNERANIANNNKGDLFICIHCNASTNKEVFGSETYVMGLHKTKGNLDVAKRENESILFEKDYQTKYEGFNPSSDEATIVFSMYQNAHLGQSLNLASKIQNQYKSKAARVDKGVKQAGFLVLWKTTMPSLLTETGFLTNPEEEKFLGSEKGQDYMASCLFRAFRDYKNEVEGKSIKYDDDWEKQPAFISEKDTAIPEVKLLASTGPNVEEKVEKKETVIPVEPKKEIGNPPLYPAKSELLFKVQILSSDRKIPLTSDKFQSLSNVSEYKAGKLFKYTVGEEKEPGSAIALQSELRKKGFKEAFVVAFKNGERIAMEEALKLVKNK